MNIYSVMKKTVTIASTLKPVNDVRVYEKFAKSILQVNKYEINVIGNITQKESDFEGIQFFKHFIKKNTFVKRFLLRFQILSLILKQCPYVLIITTYELLGTALLAKILTRCKVIYDIQENYKFNMLFLSSLPELLRFMLAHLIRFNEIMYSYFIDAFWLAEACYQDEIPFTKNKAVVIENKAFQTSFSQTKKSYLKMLFSGTVSQYSHVLLALEIFKKIKKERPGSTLHIIGQIHDTLLLEKLKQEAGINAGIQLSVSFEPVPHEDIIEAIHTCNLGLISYQENEVNKKKIPTKLYEYSRYKLPFLVQSGTHWESRSRKLGGAIPIDYLNPDVAFLLRKLEDGSNLFPEIYPERETWEAESSKLITSLNTLFK